MPATGKLEKRICVLRHFYYPADPRVRKEVEALSEAGYRVDVICLKKPEEPRREFVAGARVLRLPVQHRRSGLLRYVFEYGLFFVLATIALTLLHLRHRYDVVQVNNMPDFLVFAAIFAKLLGAKVVFDSHDPVPELYATKFKSSGNSMVPRLLMLVEKWSCRFADHVLTVSDICKERLAGRSVRTDRCTVVMNVADGRVFDPRLRNGRDDAKDTFTIVYHGALIYRYGVDVAIKAMQIVKEEDHRCRLEVIGEGESLPELVELVKELGLEKEVNLWGRSVPAEQIARIIAAADAGVVPHRGDSFTDEILPNKLLEYVAMRVPVIAARSSVIQSYFDSTMLLFFDPEDERQLAEKILKLSADPQLASSLVSNAERFNATYNWNNMKLVYRKVIDTCAKKDDENNPLRGKAESLPAAGGPRAR